MLASLNQIDRVIFEFINVTLSSPVTDFIMPFITSDTFLRILYGTAMILLLWKGNSKLRWLVLFSAIVLLFTDQISAGMLKPYFERLRPCHVLENINLLVNCGGGKSMPSAHATNVFGQAMFFGWHFKRLRWYLFGFAFIVSLSRVFVGVHYPGDIIVGSILGMILGLLVAFLSVKFETLISKDKVNLFI